MAQRMSSPGPLYSHSPLPPGIWFAGPHQLSVTEVTLLLSEARGPARSKDTAPAAGEKRGVRDVCQSLPSTDCSQCEPSQGSGSCILPQPLRELSSRVPRK